MRNWDTYNWQTATEWLTSQWQRWVTFVTLAQRRIQMDLCTCQYESVSVDLLVIWTTQTVTVNADRTHPNQVYSKGIHYNIEIFHKSSELVLTTSYTLVYTIHIGNFSKVLIQKTLYTLQYNTENSITCTGIWWKVHQAKSGHILSIRTNKSLQINGVPLNTPGYVPLDTPGYVPLDTPGAMYPSIRQAMLNKTVCNRLISSSQTNTAFIAKTFDLVYSWALRLNLIKSWVTAFLFFELKILGDPPTKTKGVLYIVSRPLC